MANVNKDDIIDKVYFNRSGIGSIQTTYRDAKAKEPSITLNNVKERFKKNTEQKKTIKGS